MDSSLKNEMERIRDDKLTQVLHLNPLNLLGPSFTTPSYLLVLPKDTVINLGAGLGLGAGLI